MPHQLHSAGVGRWHSMVTALSGPETNIKRVGSWRWDVRSK